MKAVYLQIHFAANCRSPSHFYFPALNLDPPLSIHEIEIVITEQLYQNLIPRFDETRCLICTLVPFNRNCIKMSFPVPNSTVPFWRTDLDELDNHRSTVELPAEADIVIIGAGYAGASIVHHLLEATTGSSKPPSIVILEAREACSGATGRNGLCF